MYLAIRNHLFDQANQMAAVERPAIATIQRNANALCCILNVLVFSLSLSFCLTTIYRIFANVNVSTVHNFARAHFSYGCIWYISGVCVFSFSSCTFSLIGNMFCRYIFHDAVGLSCLTNRWRHYALAMHTYADRNTHTHRKGTFL